MGWLAIGFYMVFLHGYWMVSGRFLNGCKVVNCCIMVNYWSDNGILMICEHWLADDC